MASLLLKSFTVLRGALYSAGFVWLWAWLVVSVRPLDSRIPVALPNWLRPIGFGVSTVGALLAGACIAAFVTKGRGTPAPFDPPREFVASGPLTRGSALLRPLNRKPLDRHVHCEPVALKEDEPCPLNRRPSMSTLHP